MKRPLPIDMEVLYLYAQSLIDTFRSPGAVEIYVSALSKLHKMCKLPPLNMKDYELQKIFRGNRRTSKHRVRKAAPITPEMLSQFRDLLDLSNPEDALVWALFLTCFFLLFRKSNVTPLNGQDFDREQILLREDIRIWKSVILVKVKWTKTHMCAEDTFFAPLMSILGSRLCPVQALTNMYCLIPASGKSAAFCLPNGDAFTYSMFMGKLKMLVSAIGKDPSLYSTHSFRRGGAVFLANRCGINTRLLMLQGTWKSLSFLEYLDNPLKDRASTFAKMRKTLLDAGL